ncbi:hypothetical protein AAC387_Pa07g0587 [Persea americana]
MERARNEMGVEIAMLQKEVDQLTAELCSNRGSLDRVIHERDAVQNDLGDGGTTPGIARRSEGLGTSVERRSQKKPHRLEIENF